MSAARVAIVTGGARGIGAATAQRLATEGMDVAVFDLDVESCSQVVESIEAAGRRALAVGVDITDELAVAGAVEQVASALGVPSVLVNNAGITRDNLLFKMTAKDWDAVISVHLRGTFIVTKAVQAHMVSAGYGRIVNISSASALGSRGQANYAAAKAGVMGFTKTAAIELGRFGVTVNCVAPGFIVTDMTAATAARLGLEFDEYQRQMAAATAVGRVGSPDDIAHAVAYLSSEQAGFVNGSVLYVAGGPLA